ncbi:hypothetical protein CYMTET_12398 [Cymbomonas tetramitiformis]|uniref:Uncharacterized protein n=1 Tax=Cymbomonas tetramitiformis TaxID=36881 RepID=A0AAE0GKF1_9CHLO|nr:hypothetical protein CYMTET_12398 [Cymbomonas tetramitiformis]
MSQVPKTVPLGKIVHDNPDYEEIEQDVVGVALRMAAARGELRCVRLLVEEHMAQVDERDEDGNSALHFACLCGHTEVSEYLLQNGADPLSRNERHSTTLHSAAFSGVAPLLEVLVSHAVKRATAAAVTEVEVGAERGVLPISAETLSRCKVAITMVKDGDGNTPLHEAARMGHSAAAQVLLRAGAEPAAPNAEGLTAMQCAPPGSAGDFLRLALQDLVVPSTASHSSSLPIGTMAVGAERRGESQTPGGGGANRPEHACLPEFQRGTGGKHATLGAGAGVVPKYSSCQGDGIGGGIAAYTEIRTQYQEMRGTRKKQPTLDLWENVKSALPPRIAATVSGETASSAQYPVWSPPAMPQVRMISDSSLDDEVAEGMLASEVERRSILTELEAAKQAASRRRTQGKVVLPEWPRPTPAASQTPFEAPAASQTPFEEQAAHQGSRAQGSAVAATPTGASAATGAAGSGGWAEGAATGAAGSGGWAEGPLRELQRRGGAAHWEEQRWDAVQHSSSSAPRPATGGWRAAQPSCDRVHREWGEGGQSSEQAPGMAELRWGSQQAPGELEGGWIKDDPFEALGNDDAGLQLSLAAPRVPRGCATSTATRILPPASTLSATHECGRQIDAADAPSGLVDQPKPYKWPSHDRPVESAINREVLGGGRVAHLRPEAGVSTLAGACHTVRDEQRDAGATALAGVGESEYQDPRQARGGAPSTTPPTEALGPSPAPVTPPQGGRVEVWLREDRGSGSVKVEMRTPPEPAARASQDLGVEHVSTASGSALSKFMYNPVCGVGTPRADPNGRVPVGTTEGCFRGYLGSPARPLEDLLARAAADGMLSPSSRAGAGTGERRWSLMQGLLEAQAAMDTIYGGRRAGAGGGGAWGGFCGEDMEGLRREDLLSIVMPLMGFLSRLHRQTRQPHSSTDVPETSKRPFLSLLQEVHDNNSELPPLASPRSPSGASAAAPQHGSGAHAVEDAACATPKEDRMETLLLMQGESRPAGRRSVSTWGESAAGRSSVSREGGVTRAGAFRRARGGVPAQGDPRRQEVFREHGVSHDGEGVREHGGELRPAWDVPAAQGESRGRGAFRLG